MISLLLCSLYAFTAWGQSCVNSGQCFRGETCQRGYCRWAGRAEDYEYPSRFEASRAYEGAERYDGYVDPARYSESTCIAPGRACDNGRKTCGYNRGVWGCWPNNTWGRQSFEEGIPDRFGRQSFEEGIPDRFGRQSFEEGIPDRFGRDVFDSRQSFEVDPARASTCIAPGRSCDGGRKTCGYNRGVWGCWPKDTWGRNVEPVEEAAVSVTNVWMIVGAILGIALAISGVFFMCRRKGQTQIRSEEETPLQGLA